MDGDDQFAFDPALITMLTLVSLNMVEYPCMEPFEDLKDDATDNEKKAFADRFSNLFFDATVHEIKKVVSSNKIKDILFPGAFEQQIGACFHIYKATIPSLAGIERSEMVCRTVAIKMSQQVIAEYRKTPKADLYINFERCSFVHNIETNELFIEFKLLFFEPEESQQ